MVATDVLRELAAAFPVPEERWHAHVPEMHACLRDFRAAIHALEDDRDAQAQLARLLDGAAVAGEPPPSVQHALARLDALPAPEGEHPFIAEILPTLEAMRAALLAVSVSAPAERRFRTRD